MYFRPDNEELSLVHRIRPISHIRETLLSRKFEWCSWLSRQSHTLEVPGSNPGLNILFRCGFLLQVRIYSWMAQLAARPAVNR
jgi:hypothetical protein